jgi:hypothetical protein
VRGLRRARLRSEEEGFVEPIGVRPLQIGARSMQKSSTEKQGPGQSVQFQRRDGDEEILLLLTPNGRRWS